MTAALGAACASADPGPDPAPTQAGSPQSGAVCAATLDGAVTQLPDQSTEPGARKSLLECKDGSWQDYRAEYPNSDRWLSTGPELVLHGQGVRNPEFMAGHWTGTPQESDAICHATYVQGGDDNPKITQTHEVNGDAGKPVEFEAPVRLFTVTLTGNCLWERSE
ncbi:hypothetical protein [Mycolicibacterium insubricum]|uniref:hypothetical protein n=1 Tax=Mycolicibacterium insubricum TaxID=444597 RepID=UPI0021F36553|nr:hypothetical protein [Mycolicibacterium insubricum]